MPMEEGKRGKLKDSDKIVSLERWITSERELDSTVTSGKMSGIIGFGTQSLEDEIKIFCTYGYMDGRI